MMGSSFVILTAWKWSDSINSRWHFQSTLVVWTIHSWLNHFTQQLIEQNSLVVHVNIFNQQLLHMQLRLTTVLGPCSLLPFNRPNSRWPPSPPKKKAMIIIQVIHIKKHFAVRFFFLKLSMFFLSWDVAPSPPFVCCFSGKVSETYKTPLLGAKKLAVSGHSFEQFQSLLGTSAAAAVAVVAVVVVVVVISQQRVIHWLLW